MLLGTRTRCLPCTTATSGDRKLEPSSAIRLQRISGLRSHRDDKPGVEVFTSGTETGQNREDRSNFYRLCFARFRDLAGRGLRSEHTEVEGVNVRSIYLAEHERVGKRTLVVAANALRVFTSLFGPLPFKTISIAEAPLVAGLGSCEFSGINIIASATLSTSILPPCAICRKSFASKDRRSRKVSNGPSRISSRINGGVRLSATIRRVSRCSMKRCRRGRHCSTTKTLTARKKRALF